MDKPMFPAPAGYIVDLENPQRSGVPANLWVGSVGMCIAAVFMGTRLYTKLMLARSFTSDDGALVVAWLFSIAIQAGVLFQYSNGTLGIHVWELTTQQVNRSFNLITIASILYCPFLAFAKFSLLFFYLRLSHLHWFRICVYSSMFLVIGYNIALLGPLLFPCTPLKRTWDITIEEGSCIDRTPVYMATAVLNMVTDILLLVLPIPMVVSLQMPRAQKVGLICAFGVGSATCITSGVRLVMLFPMLHTVDQTWAIVMPGLWILIEANLVIITGCLPSMRLFLRHVAPRLVGESSMRSRSRKRSTGPDHSSSEVTELQTIGSKATKNLYNRMDDDQVILTSQEDARGAWLDDQDSESGFVVPVERGQIVRTETTVIRSEALDVVDKGRVSWRIGS